MRRASALLLLVAACSSGDASTTAPVSRDAGSPHRDAGRATPDAKKPVDAGRPKDAGHDVAHDAPHEVGPTVPPVDASVNEWTWVDVPGSACANGSETGFAINPAPLPSNDVLIFFEGGGACWNGENCWAVSTAFYVGTGYTAATFATDPQVAAIYLLDRGNINNPFATMNIVYVPYCTGDVFAGSNVTNLEYAGISHETHFVGYDNVSLYLEYIKATYPEASRVWVAGDSAGGFGAALNFEHVQDALPNARVDVLDDSGQPIEPAPGLWATWSTAWNIQLPAGCLGCKTDPGAFVAYYNGKYPSHRFGLISYSDDIIIGPFMSLSPTQFNTELLGLAANMTAGWPNGHYFIIEGASHVGLLVPSPELMTWINSMVTDDPSWASETFPGDGGL